MITETAQKLKCYKITSALLAAGFMLGTFCFSGAHCSATEKADKILVNADIYTVDKNNPKAQAMAIKDGKIVYVGSNEGAKEYVGPTEDMHGQFVMPGLIDSHVHLALGIDNSQQTPATYITAETKQGAIDFIKAEIAKNPDAKSYAFYLDFFVLGSEKLTRDELDAICSDKRLLITETEQHSSWMNTKELQARGISEYAEDIAKGLSYFDRDPDGRVNGRVYEFCQIPEVLPDKPQKMYEEGIDFMSKYWKKWGVIAAFDAGQIGSEGAVNAFYQAIAAKQASGELPVYIEGCHYLYNPKQIKDAIANLEKLDNKFNTDMLRVRTMKMMSDGTINGRTAAFFDNYADVPGNGGTLLDTDTLTDFLCAMNEAGVESFHVHTVGERAVVTVQDAVEKAIERLGKDFKLTVTTAHVECLPVKYFPRFKELGILVNYTAHWFGFSGSPYETLVECIGEERASNMYKAKTMWESGAQVCFSTDDVVFDNMKTWNPYQGMEVGMTRQDGNYEATIDEDYSKQPLFPSKDERLSLDQMLWGYTINGAKQMKLDDKIGSLEVGKDASYLVFKKSLFDVDVYQIHKQLPDKVYIKGKLVE